ncbi:polyphenol oxidase family protein [Arthrobacter sp. NicSoilB8]|uniref:polyphenol oxidase family protein n=1 Tax=Arthrobacter sp. NicSoilB8 TaxID=2830998 RepID=UPI001CC40B9F|nr:polyphenol oxidase family protein [Arthrobacter sp. NicSoilB8]BCW70547.1 laccase domain protein [Arthrobacter sp. NicSoilB8]
MFSWRAEVRPGVWVAFTDVGAGNLALHVGDDPAEVRRRRAELEAAAGLGGRSFRYMNQVHGADVATISGGAATADAAEAAVAPTADAMVTLTEPLAVMVADCVPVVLVGDGPAGAPVLGVVHAGRPGVAAGVVPAAVSRLRELGAENIGAWVGPSVCGGCYEVPDGLRADVAAAVPATWCTTSTGTPGLDLPAGVRSQLEAEGVSVEYSGGCTLEDDTLFSYRRNGQTGRFAGLVWMHATDGTRGHGHD